MGKMKEFLRFEEEEAWENREDNKLVQLYIRKLLTSVLA